MLSTLVHGTTMWPQWVSIPFWCAYKDTEREIQMETYTDGGKEGDRQRDREAERQVDRPTENDTYRMTN